MTQSENYPNAHEQQNVLIDCDLYKQKGNIMQWIRTIFNYTQRDEWIS